MATDLYPRVDDEAYRETVPHKVVCVDERLRRMSLSARATYERILKLRAEIGPIDFDVVKALRELCDGD